MDNFTPKQQFLIHHLASGITVKEAMIAAGYSDTSRLSRIITPAMQAHLRQLMADRLATLAPSAVDVLSKLMNDNDSSPKNRLDAAKTILDRAGFMPPKASDAPGVGEKPLYEMNRSELEERVRQLQGEIAVASR